MSQVIKAHLFWGHFCLWFTIRDLSVSWQDRVSGGGQDKRIGFRASPELHCASLQLWCSRCSSFLSSISLGFLACQSWPLTPHPRPPTLSTQPLYFCSSFFFSSNYCTHSSPHRVWEGAWNGFPSASQSGKICDQRDFFFFQCNSNVTVWILMARQVKSMSNILHNKYRNNCI